MTKKILYSVFALALLTSTVGCPPAQSTGDVDISTDTPTTVVDDNMTGTTEMPSDNTTAITEIPTETK